MLHHLPKKTDSEQQKTTPARVVFIVWTVVFLMW